MFEGYWKIAIGEDPLESPGTFRLSAGDFWRDDEWMGHVTVEGDRAVIKLKDRVNDLDQPYTSKVELRTSGSNRLEATVETIVDGGEPLYEDAVFTRIPAPAERVRTNA